ncbi:DsrH/TusB family sulfur metabolism protein [Pseudomonas asuensis]
MLRTCYRKALDQTLYSKLPVGIKGFVLREDVEARGLNETSRFDAIDYEDFVSLCVTYDKVQSW